MAVVRVLEDIRVHIVAGIKQRLLTHAFKVGEHQHPGIPPRHEGEE